MLRKSIATAPCITSSKLYCHVCQLVDIKRLSANQLHLAIDSKWCHVYNEMHRGRSNKPTHLDYDQADFDDLLRLVKDHPVYQSIDKSKENY